MSKIFKLQGQANASAFANNTWICQQGEHWIIRGKNGSGKTFLTSLIAGEAVLPRLSINFSPAYEDRIALVSFAQQQAHAANGWLQARWHATDDTSSLHLADFLSFDNIHHINPFEIRPPETAARAAFKKHQQHIIALFNLAPIWNNLLLQLSNGEMRRALLAHALLSQPRLLLLDDPFAGLDTTMRQQLHTILENLADQGITLIISVRHNDEIPACMTHVLTLDNCRIKSKRCLNYTPLNHTPAPPDTSGKRTSTPPVPPLTLPPANGTSPIITMRNVTISYGSRTLINQLNWQVFAGEHWLIIGPNGCGKTTLLSLINGDNPAAYSHNITIFGQPRHSGTSLWQIRSRIAQLSPELQCHFNPSTTVLNAAQSGRYSKSGAELNPSAKSRQAARYWLNRFGLANHETTHFGALSSGQQRLILLIRALIATPDLLLLDEPCLNLDHSARKTILTAISTIIKEQAVKTIICVAHRPDETPTGLTHTLHL